MVNCHRKYRGNTTGARSCNDGNRVYALEPLAGKTVQQEADSNLAHVDDDNEDDLRCKHDL
jgi:hypothetical protein